MSKEILRRSRYPFRSANVAAFYCTHLLYNFKTAYFWLECFEVFTAVFFVNFRITSQTSRAQSAHVATNHNMHPHFLRRLSFRSAAGKQNKTPQNTRTCVILGVFQKKIYYQVFIYGL